MARIGDIACDIELARDLAFNILQGCEIESPFAVDIHGQTSSGCHDLRTNQHFTLKQKPIQRSDFDDFVACYKPGRTLSLDLFWIKDKSLTDTDALPPPGVIAAEIADDLEAALQQFTKIAARLK